MVSLNIFFVTWAAFANTTPGPACAFLLWPAARSVNIAAEYPLRDGRPDRVANESPWGAGAWSQADLKAWSALATRSARSGRDARAVIFKIADGHQVEGLSDLAHHRLRSAMVIHREGERIEDAIYQSRLVDYGFLEDHSTRALSAFTGKFGPALTPSENAALPDLARLWLSNKAYLDSVFSESTSIRNGMRSEARSLRILFRRIGSRDTLKSEDAIYLVRSLLRESLLARSTLGLDEDARLLLSFHPELFPIWPQLNAWKIAAHDLELSLGDSYFNSPNVSLTTDDLINLQIRREASEVDKPPYREDVTASLVVTRKGIRHPTSFEYEQSEVDRAVRRLTEEFKRFAPRFGLRPVDLDPPVIEDFSWFFLVKWSPDQVPAPVLIAFYASLFNERPTVP